MHLMQQLLQTLEISSVQVGPEMVGVLTFGQRLTASSHRLS